MDNLTHRTYLSNYRKRIISQNNGSAPFVPNAILLWLASVKSLAVRSLYGSLFCRCGRWSWNKGLRLLLLLSTLSTDLQLLVSFFLTLYDFFNSNTWLQTLQLSVSCSPDVFQILLVDNLKKYIRPIVGWMYRTQLTVHSAFWYTSVIHSGYVSQQSRMMLLVS